MGFTKAINQRQVGDGMDFAIRPMSTPNSATLFPGLISPLLTPAQWVVDTHPSWNNVQSDEKHPAGWGASAPAISGHGRGEGGTTARARAEGSRGGASRLIGGSEPSLFW